jgi:hypothetical protein
MSLPYEQFRNSRVKYLCVVSTLLLCFRIDWNRVQSDATGFIMDTEVHNRNPLTRYDTVDDVTSVNDEASLIKL